MSVYQDRALICPHCQHRTVQSVAVSLNAARAARQRAAILDGTFQRFACPNCAQSYRADGPLIYIDFDEQLWIGVFPEPFEARWWRYEREPQLAFDRNMLEHAPAMVREWAPGFTIRTVFGLECLREKLVAWAARLDDRLLEAYKLSLLRSMGPYQLGPAARPRLRAVHDQAGATKLEFWVPRAEEGKPLMNATISIAGAELERVAAERDQWATVIEALSAGPYVDLGRIFIPRSDDDEPAVG